MLTEKQKNKRDGIENENSSLLNKIISELQYLRHQSEKIDAIASLLILKEVNPKIISNIIPHIDMHPDVLNYDIHERFKKEKSISTLCDIVASCIVEIHHGCKSAPWEQSKKTIITALDSASINNKDLYFDTAIANTVYLAADMPFALELGELFSTFSPDVAWHPRHKKFWNIYLCALLAMNQEDNALSVLEKIEKQFSLSGVETHLQVASFAHTHGFTSAKIARANVIYNTMKRNHKLLESYLSDKTVAIIGGGPQELGKGLGEQIDTHSAVIRCNSNIKERKHISDYGKKTDIYALAPLIQGPSVEHYAHTRETDVIFIPYSCEVSYYTPFMIDFLYDTIVKFPKCNIACMPFEFNYELISMLQDNFGLCLSTGSRLVAYIKSIMGDRISLNNIFGFSFKYPYTQLSWRKPFHYYASNFEYGMSPQYVLTGHAHNFKQERIFLRNLFKETLG